MTEYTCSECDMSVKGLKCGKCGSDLKNKIKKNDQGKQLNVAECPNECGKVAAPTCCGTQMKVSS